MATSLAAGCAESTVLRSEPPGAKMFVDGRFVGESPVNYTVPRSQWKDGMVCRAELPGYRPAELELSTAVGGGRVTAGVFSLGVSFIFKRPGTFAEPAYTVRLDPEPVPDSTSSQDLTVKARLKRLEDLWRSGSISAQEYEAHRKAILREL